MLAQVYLLFGRKGTRPFESDPFLRDDVHQLGLGQLETAALDDVTAKTSAANIIRETFSKSTAR